MRQAIAILAAVILVLVAVAFRLSPLWPGPALPDGATRLHIATAVPHLVPAFGCPTALLEGHVATGGDELIVLSAFDNRPVGVVWPSGWAAWRIDGRAELVSRDGVVVAREGGEIAVGGGVGPDDLFHVCIAGR